MNQQAPQTLTIAMICKKKKKKKKEREKTYCTQSPCIYNDYFKVFLFEFIYPFLSYDHRIHFSVTTKKRNKKKIDTRVQFPQNIH